LVEQYKYNVLYIIRNHIHPDLKSEYVMEEKSSTLWVALQTYYGQQNAIILPDANHDWILLRLQDYKEPSKLDKIEKIVQTISFLQTRSYNTNNVLEITKITHIVLMISSK
jgi:hypothetical protein